MEWCFVCQPHHTAPFLFIKDSLMDYFLRLVSIVCILLSLQVESLVAQVTAVKRGSHIDVTINGRFFTSYISSIDEKYPFFYPVNGPSGASVTSMRNGTYPHHSSLFFGCDKVNGGNYWQEDIDRGQILAIQTHIRQSGTDVVVIEQECIWHRPEALAPIKDFRTITISAPGGNIYQLDFDVSLEMLMDVEIEKTNHSLFSARVDPDIAVTNGGTMINAEGDHSEEKTFGQRSPWMDISGQRGDFVEGIAIMQHPDNRWYPAPWFTRDYGFISPTPMYWPEDEKGIKLQKGEMLSLKYRVIVHRGEVGEVDIARHFEKYIGG